MKSLSDPLLSSSLIWNKVSKFWLAISLLDIFFSWADRVGTDIMNAMKPTVSILVEIFIFLSG